MMRSRLERSIQALSPIMSRTQAEGFLHIAAFTRRKSFDALTAEDWPAVERAVREAVAHTSAEPRVEHIITRLRAAYLEDAELTEQ